MALFATHRAAIKKIMRRHRLKRLVAFGSRARGDARPESDLDLAAEFGPESDPLAPLAAERELEDLLGVKVALVDLPNPRVEKAIRREGVWFDGRR